MADEPKRKRRPPLPNFFQCGHSLKRLRRFAGLLRHDRRFGSELAVTPPIEELLPKGALVDDPFAAKREIVRLIPLVVQDLLVAGIPTGFSYPERDALDFSKTKTRNVDVIADYTRLPDEGSTMGLYGAALEAVDQGVAVFERLREWRHRQLFNPVFYVAQLLRLPVTVLEMADLVDTDDAVSGVRGWYGWALKIVFLLILVFVAAKLGLSVPWKSILPAAAAP